MMPEAHTIPMTFTRDDRHMALLQEWVSTDDHGRMSCGAGLGSPWLVYDRSGQRWILDIGDLFKALEKLTREEESDA